MCEIKIRLAAPDDAEDILNIYKYYVLNTAVSFEYIVPEIEEFKNRYSFSDTFEIGFCYS